MLGATQRDIQRDLLRWVVRVADMRTHFTGLSFPGLGLVEVQVMRAVPHATMHMHTKHTGPATESANSATTSRTTIPGRETAHKASAQGETLMEGGRRSLGGEGTGGQGRGGGRR